MLETTWKMLLSVSGAATSKTFLFLTGACTKSRRETLHNLLTCHGCSCNSWEHRRESCPLNRRHRRSLGCSAPAATRASLPRSLASLSFRWRLGKKTNKTAGHQPSFFFPPLPSVHPAGTMLYFSAGSQPGFQKGDSTILVTWPQKYCSGHIWTSCMLRAATSHEVKSLHRFPLSCPCTSQFMFQENREKGAAVTAKTSSCVMLW